MNIFSIVKYQLYLLQLENYELSRYWQLLKARGFWDYKQPRRKNLVWTAKLTVLFFLSAIAEVIIAAVIVFFLRRFFTFPPAASVLLFLIIWYLLALCSFLFFYLGDVILWPFDRVVKSLLAARAKKYLKKFPKLIVIGIAGSYGKTTMKQVLASIIGADKNVVAAPESYNVPVSIARFILKNVNSQTEVLILEMGEHYKGDIKELCEIAAPDIAVVTGINQSHLERFGTLEQTTETIFEITKYSRAGATLLLNADDAVVRRNCQKFANNKKVLWYGARSGDLTDIKIESQVFDEDNLTQTVKLRNGGGFADVFTTGLLGAYAAGNIMAGIIIGRLLNEPAEKIILGVQNLKPVEHRLQPIKSARDVLVIDDSYNGNPDGVYEAIELLKKFSRRRKLFITPGLVETGPLARDIHQNIGKQLASAANKVLLIKNSVTPFIEAGLLEAGFKPENIVWFNSTPEAHAQLGGILQPGDVILFQNDWGDQYL